MKHLLLLIVAAILAAFVNPVQAIDPPSKFTLTRPDAGVSMDVFLGFLPRENPANLALQGETWVPARDNWVGILRTGGSSAGSGYSLAAKQSTPDYNWLITSTFNSWGGELDSTSQFGNRHHFGLRIHAIRPGVTFRMQDITTQVQSFIFGSSGWAADGVVNISTNLSVLNAFRLRLEAGTDGINGTNDDPIATVQSSSLPSTSCLFGGLGVAMGAYGSGDNAQKLRNVYNYCSTNHLVFKVTVTVPYTENGQPFTSSASAVFWPATQQWSEQLPEGTVVPPLTLALSESELLLGQDKDGPFPATNGLYVVEKSTDLQAWTPVAPAAFGSGLLTPFRIGDYPSAPRYFYRGRMLVPATQSTMMARQVRSTPIGKPSADTVAP